MRNLFLLALVGLAASNALAGPIEKNGNWVLNELATGSSVVCEASTADNGFLRDYTLKIQKAKNSYAPVEIFLQETGKPLYGPLATAIFANEIILLNQMAIAEKSQIFWYLPDETKQLVDYLRSGAETFQVQPYAGLKGNKLTFKLKGAAEILASMEKRCNAGKPLVDARLSAYTNHPAAWDQAPKIFDAATVNTLRGIQLQIAGQHNQLLLQEDALAKLVDQNRPKIDERENLKVERTYLTNQKIPDLKQNILATTSKIAATEQRLASLKTEVPAADKARAVAQARYDDALKKIQPHAPKHAQLVDELSYARRSLADAESDLSNSENEIAANARKIRELDSRAQQLTSTIQSLRNEIPSAQYEADRTLREYNSYDADYEIRRRIDQSSRYQALEAEEDRLKSDLRQEKALLMDLNRRQMQAKSALQTCQTSAGATCDAEKANLATITQQMDAKESEVRNVENKIASARREMDSIANDIEREVRRVQERLRDAYNDAASRLSNLQSRIDQAEAERRDIVEYEIPRLRNRNMELESLVAQLERQIVSLKQEVRSAETALASFDQSVGYATLQKNLDSADAQLDSAKDLLERLTAEDARLKVQLPQDKALLVQLNANLNGSEVRLTQVIARIGQLDKDLAPFDASKAAIDAKMNQIREQIKQTQSVYMKYFA